MSCPYADIAMVKYDSLANKFHFKPSVCKRFRDIQIFFLDYLNTIDQTGKVNFTTEISRDTGLEFFYLKIKISEGIRVYVHAKSINSFSYTTPNTCYPKNNICNIPKYSPSFQEDSVMIMKPSKNDHQSTKTT